MHFETPLEFLESRTYDEINVGDSSSLVRTLRPEDVKLFALMSGDMNPALANAEFSHSGVFQDFIAHGMWCASLLSTMLGTQFPGPGTVMVESSAAFRAAGGDRRHAHGNRHRRPEIRPQPAHPA
jgi:phosphate acetyltransferase